MVDLDFELAWDNPTFADDTSEGAMPLPEWIAAQADRYRETGGPAAEWLAGELMRLALDAKGLGEGRAIAPADFDRLRELRDLRRLREIEREADRAGYERAEGRHLRDRGPESD